MSHGNYNIFSLQGIIKEEGFKGLYRGKSSHCNFLQSSAPRVIN